MSRLRRRLTGSASLRAPRNEGILRCCAVASADSRIRSRRPACGALRQVGAERLRDLGVGQPQAVHASASIAFSSAARAACSRHFAVPTGIPSDRAISATGRSSTWWRTRSIRSCGRSRSKAREIASLSTTSSVFRSGVRIPRRFGLWGLVARVSRPNGHLAKPDPMPARHQRSVRHDPVEPAIEGRRITQARKLSPSGHERVLGRVGRVGVVGEDRPGETVAAIDPGIDERLERRRVAGASAPNERIVGRRRLVRRCRQRIHVTLGSSIVALASRDVAVDRCSRVSRCRRGAAWLGRRE